MEGILPISSSSKVEATEKMLIYFMYNYIVMLISEGINFVLDFVFGSSSQR